MPWPSRGLAASLPDDPGAERDDYADLFGHGDEIVRRHQAARGVTPAQQRLAACDGLGLGVDLRLIVEFEFLVGDRAPQLELQQTPFLNAGVHRVFEEAIGVAA